jgi:hypothetical protein
LAGWSVEVGTMIDLHDEELRERAIQQLRNKRELRAHLAAYVLVNAFLVGIWAITGAGFFWPLFPILGWGIGVFFHGYDVYSRPPTEARIREAMSHLKG